MTKREAVRILGSEYHVAKICDIHQSAVSRWGKYVPEWHVAKILAVPPERRKLKRGGLRVKS